MSGKAQWQPSASPDIIRARAELLSRIRAFMTERGILEVETPMLGHCSITDPFIEPLSTSVSLPDRTEKEVLYLHTSPEYCMKRLLAAGAGSIYQICKVFRDAELGQRHQPEFSMLEWYRIGFDHHDLIRECMELLDVLGIGPCRKTSYQALFHQYTGLDPHTAELDALRQYAMHKGYADPQSGRHELLDFIFNRVVVDGMNNETVFVYDYPECMAALARISQGPQKVAERFELFIKGMEIANGFHELCDASEQRQRFMQEQEIRMQQGKSITELDEYLLKALEQGIPDCAGVAIGLDRLLMVISQCPDIEDVLSFPLTRN